MQTHKIILLISTLFIILLTTSVSYGQTTYEKEPGFFTPVVESLYLHGGIFEDTQLIGPALGYRFNNKYDLSLHAELLSAESEALMDAPTIQLSILNLGITAGQTTRWQNGILFRNELSLYRTINLNLDNYQGLESPSLTSLLGTSSFFKSLRISESITFLPNIGGIIGFGDFQPPLFTSANLRQGFDGFVAGPQIGLDTRFSLGDSFSITAKPQYRLRYNFTHDQSKGTVTFNVLFNF